MDPVAATMLGSWSLRPEVLLGLAAATLLYLRGFRELRAQLPQRFPDWRRGAFLAGVGVLAVALLSPLDAFADLLLQLHMLQHWLLMMVAPPLLWLGAPVVPMLRGLPRSWLRRGLGPFLAWPRLRNTFRALTHPAVTWLAWALATLMWHWPPAYQLALASQSWHEFEHLSFLGASLLFWYPLINPWPAQPRIGAGARVLYLGLAAVFNTVFSAAFAFSTRVFYPAYLDAPRLWDLSALEDQNAAGAFLWVAASLPMLAMAAVTLYVSLDPIGAASARAMRPHRPPPRRPIVSWRAVWVRVLQSLPLRRALQWVMLGLAAVIVVDGLFGPQRPSALNLAGVLPWTYWRGFVVIGLVLAGNLFCAVCPFTLPRSLAGRWLGRPWRWPAALSNKWLAVLLFATYLWAYEAFALWDSPWWTAWIVVGYFAACFLVEGLFPRGTFCRHLCPIGQFHFVGSGVSPIEIRAFDADRCASCTTHDCLRGNAQQRGCPTGLFLPGKQGSLDCTFCMDCVRACPHDNAGLVAVPPGASLGRGRSGGTARLDLAALALVFSFGAFANAGAMLAPVALWERGASQGLGLHSTLLVLTLWLLGAMLLLPWAAAAACAALARVLGKVQTPVKELVARFAPTLVPVGFSMWLAHFAFHLMSGAGSAGPAFARGLQEIGLSSQAGRASVGMSMGASDPGLQMAVLGMGLVVSVGVAWRVAREHAARPARSLGLAAPWWVLALALYGIGVWISLQPMEMRGMLM